LLQKAIQNLGIQKPADSPPWYGLHYGLKTGDTKPDQRPEWPHVVSCPRFRQEIGAARPLAKSLACRMSCFLACFLAGGVFVFPIADGEPLVRLSINNNKIALRSAGAGAGAAAGLSPSTGLCSPFDARILRCNNRTTPGAGPSKAPQKPKKNTQNTPGAGQKEVEPPDTPPL
jgi:hypothetical protein